MARRLHYPITLTTTTRGARHQYDAGGRALAPGAKWRRQRNERREPRHRAARHAAGRDRCLRNALATDPVFGPVIAVGPSAHGTTAPHARAVMLPPLNRRLASDLLTAAGIGAPRDELVDLLLRVSALACALPWVRALLLDPIVVAGNRLAIPSARVVVDPKRKPAPGYRHMAIHPYPVELESQIVLADGTKLVMRPIRPEDAELERRFVASMSDQTRYYRFFYQLHELSPAMLARSRRSTTIASSRCWRWRRMRKVPGGVAIVGVALHRRT